MVLKLGIHASHIDHSIAQPTDLALEFLHHSIDQNFRDFFEGGSIIGCFC